MDVAGDRVACETRRECAGSSSCRDGDQVSSSQSRFFAHNQAGYGNTAIGPAQRHEADQYQQPDGLCGSARDGCQAIASSKATHSAVAISDCQFESLMDELAATAAVPPPLFGSDSEDTTATTDTASTIDACEIEPSIGRFAGGDSAAAIGSDEDIEGLLFSEFIDLQHVPMNVDESDWLKKFLPPCSMS